MSPADSVIVFLLVIVAIYVVLFVATLPRNARSQARSNNRILADAGARTAINADDAAIAKRLSSSASNLNMKEPHGMDVGGNYS